MVWNRAGYSHWFLKSIQPNRYAAEVKQSSVLQYGIILKSSNFFSVEEQKLGFVGGNLWKKKKKIFIVVETKCQR